MKYTLQVIAILSFLLIGYFALAQKPKAKIAPEVIVQPKEIMYTTITDSIRFGRYTVDANSTTSLLIPKYDLFDIDSLSCTNANTPVDFFTVEVNPTSAMGNLYIKEGVRKFPAFYYNIISKLNPPYIKIDDISISKNGERLNIKGRIIIKLNYSYAFIYDFPSKNIIKNIDTISKASFLGNDRINLKIGNIKTEYGTKYALTTCTINVSTQTETKSFTLPNNLIPAELKKFVSESKGEVKIHIKDIVAKNEKGHAIEFGRIKLTCTD